MPAPFRSLQMIEIHLDEISFDLFYLFCWHLSPVDLVPPCGPIIVFCIYCISACYRFDFHFVFNICFLVGDRNLSFRVQ